MKNKWFPAVVLFTLFVLAIWPAFAKPVAVDGDTIALEDGTNMRLMGYDAPEISQPNCPAERALGYYALGRLQHLIKLRGVRVETVKGLDKYRRRLGRLYLGGEDVATILIREELAVPYDGRSRRVYWAKTMCGLDAAKLKGGFLPDP